MCIDDMRLAEDKPPLGFNCEAIFNEMKQKSAKNSKLEVHSMQRPAEASTQLFWHSWVTIDGVVMNDGVIDKNKTASTRKAVLVFFK